MTVRPSRVGWTSSSTVLTAELGRVVSKNESGEFSNGRRGSPFGPDEAPMPRWPVRRGIDMGWRGKGGVGMGVMTV